MDKINKLFVMVIAVSIFTLSPIIAYSEEESTMRNRLPSLCQAIIDNPNELNEEKRLHDLFDLYWDYQMEEFPEMATFYGYPRQNDRWTDQSKDAVEQRERNGSVLEKTAQSIQTENLSEVDRLNHRILLQHIQNEIIGTRFDSEYMPITQLDGTHTLPAKVLSVQPSKNLTDYNAILSRLRNLPVLLKQSIALMEEGVNRGVTPPQITLRGVPEQIANQIPEESSQSPLMVPFQKIPSMIAAKDQKRLREDAESIYKNDIIPAYRELAEYVEKTYLPKARQSIACRDLPNGMEWYRHNVRVVTTTDLNPQAIHEIGLSEVKRIRGEMETVMRSSGFQGELPEFFEFLRSDPKFFFDKPEDLLRQYRNIAKRADPELMKLFGVLPRTPYGVIPVPEYEEKSQTTAYYWSGSVEAGRPGYFYANTYDLKSRPKWEMEALTLHEAVPGHHLQLSLNDEMDIPRFRKLVQFTAFAEGWGLYSEKLGEEIGFYKDPYSKFGQLTYEMWRAIRLVVDTGMHAMGWSRQQAIDYFKENASKTEHDIVVEIDRYIVWPGQALAYKIGELKILELRHFAEQELGDRFDIRAFHDTLLGNGMLPLNILESKMKEWVEEMNNEKK